VSREKTPVEVRRLFSVEAESAELLYGLPVVVVVVYRLGLLEDVVVIPYRQIN